MGRKTTPCNAKEGWFYNGGRVCSKCDKCPGGHGRDMSKQVINTTETHGDLECIQCEVCPPKMYNNGGRKGCKKCLDDCAGRNRHDCPVKATQLCGECLDGHHEVYNVPDDPSTCIPCTEKEKSIVSACANLTTITPSPTAATFPDTTLIRKTAFYTTPLGTKTTKYSYIPNRATTEDVHVFGRNISAIVQNKAVESKNDNSPSGHGPWLLALGALTPVIFAFLAIWVICRYFKKRRRRKQSEADQRIRTVSASDSQLMIGTCKNSVDSSLLASTSENSVDSSLLASTYENSVDSSLLAGTFGNSVDSPLPAGTSANSEDDINVTVDDLRLDNDIETDTKPVPKEMDRNRWINRHELLKSKVSIHQLCAKNWITLDREYLVLSMSKNDVQLLEKEAHNKGWPPEELNFKILAKWTHIKGNQATVQALCDALLENEHYDIIEDIMKEIP